MSATNEKYKAQYEQMHEAGSFAGYSLRGHWDELLRFLEATDSKTILDYGCGKGGIWKGIDLEVSLYDPYYPPFSRKPDGLFDCVVCSDVLEHVPEEDIDDFLMEAASYATKAIFLTVCCRPAKKRLPNGENAHITLKDMSWWQWKINRASAHWPRQLFIGLVENE